MCQEKLGQVDPAVVKAVGAFGGGLAGTGDVCGVMLAGVAVISSMYSRSGLDEKENPRMWSLSHTFIKKFKELTEEHGGTHCSNIARVNWQDRGEVKEFYTSPDSRRKECIQLVGDAVFYLGELLEAEAERAAQTASA